MKVPLLFENSHVKAANNIAFGEGADLADSPGLTINQSSP